MKHGNISIRYDKISSRKYYIIENVTKDTLTELSRYLKLTEEEPTPFIAKRLNDAVVKLTNNDLVILRDTDIASARKYLLGDYNEYPYEISFKLAEYHAYVAVRNLKSDKDAFISIAPKVSGATFGESYLRDDRAYEEKYFKGEKYYSHGYKNPHFDQGSISVSFHINQNHFQDIKQHLVNFEEKVQTGTVEYNFFTKNCIVFCHEIFNLFADGSYMDYHITDELDLRDKGIFRSLVPSLNFKDLIYNPHYLADLVTNEFGNMEFKQLINKAFLSTTALLPFTGLKTHLANYLGGQKLHHLAYSGELTAEYLSGITEDQLNAQNYFGETALHTSLHAKNIEAASSLLNAGANPNIPNNKGEIPLHILATLQLDKSDLEFASLLIENTLFIDKPNDINSTNTLLEAARTDQVELIKLLLQADADISFSNYLGENAAHIAAISESANVIEFIEAHYDFLLQVPNKDSITPLDIMEQISLETAPIAYPIANVSSLIDSILI